MREIALGAAVLGAGFAMWHLCAYIILRIGRWNPNDDWLDMSTRERKQMMIQRAFHD